MSSPGLQLNPANPGYLNQPVSPAMQQQAMRQRLIQAMMQNSQYPMGATQPMQQQGAVPLQPQPSNTAWGGLANAGNSIAGALAYNKMQQQADPNYQTDMTRYGMTPQQIQNAAGAQMSGAAPANPAVNPVAVQAAGPLANQPIVPSAAQQGFLAGLYQ